MKLTIISTLLATVATSAFAQVIGNPKGTVVPEIDAMAGVAAVAAVAGVVALVRERMKG